MKEVYEEANDGVDDWVWWNIPRSELNSYNIMLA